MIAGTPDRHRWGEAYDWLADHLSAEDLAAFVQRFGGRLMRVPRQVRESRRQRTARVLAELEGDVTYDEAAAAVGVSRASAVRYANRPE